jgi:hypothetical protein
VFKIPASNSGRPGFKSRSEDWLSCLLFLLLNTRSRRSVIMTVISFHLHKQFYLHRRHLHVVYKLYLTLLLLLLQLKTVLLLDALQLLMLSAGTVMSSEIIMFPWNTFYCEQDTVFMLSIYLIVCVQKSIYFIFFPVLLFYVRLYIFRNFPKKKNNIYFKDTFSERLTVQIH